MKKLFRMALVLALAGSALLYTSCTKDYSPDISSLQDQIDKINSDPNSGLPWVRTQLESLSNTLDGLKGKVTIGDDELNTRINNLRTELNNAVNTINEALDGKADKTYVDAEILRVEGLIDGLKEDLETRLDAIDGEDGSIAGLEEQIAILQQLIDDLGSASEAIDSQFGEYAKFIQSIAYVPGSTLGFETAYAYTLTDEETVSDTILVLSFMVTPPEAVTRVNDETAKMVAVATKAAAAAPTELEIKKLVYRDDAPGYVDVYAVVKGLKYQQGNGNLIDLPIPTFAVALEAEQTVGEGDEALIESVTSDYANVICAPAQPLVFEIYDAEEDDIIVDYRYDHEVRVSPTSPKDSVVIFTEGRWSVVADVAGSYMTPEEAQEFFGVDDIALVSPLPEDTVYDYYGNTDYYAYEENAFESTVHPKRPKTVVDCVVDEEPYFEFGLAIKNTHTGDPSRYESGWAVGVYHAVPDTVAITLTPQDVHEGPIDVIIPWDYKYYDNIKDTLIAKIHVDGDREKLMEPDSTNTWNKETEEDYTEGVGAVTRHTNDNSAIDVNLLSAAEYGVVDSTYVYSIEKFDKTTATVTAGQFDYLVKARPADAVIEYTVDTIVRYEKIKTVIDFEAILGPIKEHAEYYANYPVDTVANDMAKGNPKMKADSAVVYVNGERVPRTSVGLSGKIAYDVENHKDLSNIALYLNEPGEWKIYLYRQFAGVKYLEIVTINVAPNSARIAPKDTYVTVENPENPKEYSVQVKGDVDTAAGAANRYHYYLIDQPFQDYVKIVDYALGSDSLIVALNLITPEAEGEVTVPSTPVGLERLPASADTTVANLAEKGTFSWGTYDSLEFKVAVTLIPEVDQEKIVDSAAVRLWTANPIPIFDGGDGLTVEHEKDQLAKANIAAALNIVDLNGIKLNDEKGLRAIGYDAKAKEVVVNYDQTITYGEPELISGADFIEELKLYWDSTQPGVLCLDLNQGTIVTPIEIRVPVKLSHMLDRGLEMNTAYVYVTFVEKGEN